MALDPLTVWSQSLEVITQSHDDSSDSREGGRPRSRRWKSVAMVYLSINRPPARKTALKRANPSD